jgi:AcrR family transcriptional regulator
VKAATRRTPVQERSRRRVEVMLDAAAELFAASSFDAVSMEQIAARAKTSIGSIYQFFPNKLALFEALARRSLDRSRQLGEMVTLSAKGRPWREVLDQTIDGFVALLEGEPGFRAIWTNFQLYGVYAAADAELHDELVGRALDIVGEHAPQLPRAKRELAARMVVQVISGVLFLSSREEPRAYAQMIEEAKLVLRRYLEPYLDPAP